MILPAPNITGNLHMGHALNVILQDIYIRYHYTRGKNTVWFPGTDHGGIATQNVIENMFNIYSTSNGAISRNDFIENVYEWKDEIIPRIFEQILSFGACPDFNNSYFTMDAVRSKGVQEAFIRLYKNDLIYKDNGIVNWCPRCNTALSEVELEIKEELQLFYFVKYRIKNSNEYIPVMTMRPETIRGDVAIAVNPNDERYKNIIGKFVVSPIFNHEIPVIGELFVNKDFGLGAVRVTPGHVPNDFVLSKKYNFPIVKVISQQGIMTNINGDFSGLTKTKCREKFLSLLTDQTLIIKSEKFLFGNPYCYRCKSLIEPHISKQWYLKIGNLIDPAIKLVESGEIDMQPPSSKKEYIAWMKKLKERNVKRENWWEGSCITAQMGFSSNKDWCISRDIWWGHEIPAWTCEKCNKLFVNATIPEKCDSCGSSKLVKEEGVLDMWFSCALWPLNVLGWPENTPFMKNFFPQNLVFTGYDVLYFWVTTTIMLIHELTGQKPYNAIVLHGLVCDNEGKKMSKTFGNIINPNEIINKFGADSLRLALINKTESLGKDIKISENVFSDAKSFLDEIWSEFHDLRDITNKYNAEIKEENIISSLEDEIISSLKEYDLKKFSLLITDFYNSELKTCLKIIKDYTLKKNIDVPNIKEKIILTNQLARYFLFISHPIIPFITEELWRVLGCNISFRDFYYKNFKFLNP